MLSGCPAVGLLLLVPTWPLGPTACASIMARSPLPQQTSSALCPGLAPDHLTVMFFHTTCCPRLSWLLSCKHSHGCVDRTGRRGGSIHGQVVCLGWTVGPFGGQMMQMQSNRRGSGKLGDGPTAAAAAEHGEETSNKASYTRVPKLRQIVHHCLWPLGHHNMGLPCHTLGRSG